MFTAEAAKVVLGFITAVITARWLGAEGKGTLSTLLFIGVLLSYACTMGLGDAATLLVARGRYTLQQAASASLLPIAAACVVGATALWVVVPIAGWDQIVSSVIVATLLLPIATCTRLVTAVINTREHIAFTSFTSAASVAVSTIALIVLVVALQMDLFGAMLATLLGASAGLIWLIRFLRKMGISPRPALVGSYVKESLRFGWLVEFSYLLVAMSQRLDLLLVYTLMGEAPAGRYSIALTMSQLCAYAPFALIMASFPRLAHLRKEAFLPLVTQLFRISLMAGAGAASLLAVVLPVVVEPIFGSAFRGAAAPALLLLPAAILGSQQWLLARAAVSGGNNRVYPTSFAVSVALLVLLDYVLVPRFGLMGAAIAATISSTMGLAVCVVWFRRVFKLRLRDLRFQKQDLATLRRVARSFLPAGNEAE